MLNKRAVILAAGLGSRFSGQVKGLLSFRDETLLQRQVRLLNKFGIEDITVVTGHNADRLEKEIVGAKFLFNPNYATKDNAESLRLFLEVTGTTSGAFIFDSDIYYDEQMLQDFILSVGHGSLYLSDFYRSSSDAMKVTLAEDKKTILKFSKEEGVGAGIAVYLNSADQAKLFQTLQNPNEYRWWIQAIKNIQVQWINPFLRWIDIDDEKDLRRAEIIFSVDYKIQQPGSMGGRITPAIMRELYEAMNFDGFHKDKRTNEKDAVMLYHSLCVSATYKGQIIGFARAVSDGVYDAGIYDVMVLPQYQTCGIGNCLMLHLLQELKKENYIKIFLFSARGKEQWYGKFGFNIARANVLEIRND